MTDANTTQNSLQQLLTRLHGELSAAGQIDESSRHQLREALRDIERALGQQRPVAQAPRSRLADLAARFDAAHPALAAGIREFVDLLGGAGL